MTNVGAPPTKQCCLDFVDKFKGVGLNLIKLGRPYKWEVKLVEK